MSHHAWLESKVHGKDFSEGGKVLHRKAKICVFGESKVLFFTGHRKSTGLRTQTIPKYRNSGTTGKYPVSMFSTLKRHLIYFYNGLPTNCHTADLSTY